MPEELSPPVRPLAFKVIGVGGAGGTVVDLMARGDLASLSLALVHTSTRAIQHHAVPQKLLLGASHTHGLGTGGDPEFARILAEGETDELKKLCGDADLIFIVAGLGGGTGTGVAPVLAAAAKEAGALVLCFVTLPFEFEGPRRLRQAQIGLQQLRLASDAVICLPHQKVSKTINEETTALNAFRRSDELLIQGVRAIWQMLTRPGLIKVDFAYLYSVIRGRHAESSFATAEASGENRAQELVQAILESPLLDEGKSLAQADAVLASLVGGPDLTISDVNKIMEQINRRVESGHVVMGAAVDEAFSGRIALTLIASKNGKAAPAVAEESISEIKRFSTSTGSSEEIDTSFFEKESTPRPVSRFVAPAPVSTPEKTEQLFQKQGRSKGTKSASKWKQELLALEIVSRDRFQKSEPTIHQGADLDVPTYIRKGIAFN